MAKTEHKIRREFITAEIIKAEWDIFADHWKLNCRPKFGGEVFIEMNREDLPREPIIGDKIKIRVPRVIGFAE
jgi:hypothetical protein